tara:strand:+ start:1420 stop:2316 length:897 start_codon:yes stop_codon:yes gene_type:complete
MKIFDCFMYFDEDLVLELRLNFLSKFVDQFIIVESKFNHKGEKRELKFDLKNFKKFENKITYINLDIGPEKIYKISPSDTEKEKDSKYISNSAKRENFQRNQIIKGLNNAHENDWIIVSDIDEIPNLKNIDLKKIKNKLVFFKQDMMYYKFNLKYDNFVWVGSKACKKKDLISPQWLRSIKDRNYPWWRFDTFFSKLKYTDIKFIEEGGWHFSYIKTPDLIEKKLRSYLHHREYDLNPIGIEGIKKMIENKTAIYNLKHDQRSLNKIGSGAKLTKVNLDILPEYISSNKEKFNEWLDY